MDPATIAMLGQTALSLLGGISGNKQAKKQTALEERMLASQEAIQREQLALAKELANRGIATQIDANGNITAYDKATNTWKTVLSETQQKIQDLSDVEQIQQLQTDAPMSRIESILNATRRSKEGTLADGVRSNISDLLSNPVRGSDLASSLRLGRENAVNKGFDAVSSSLGTQALRSGATGGAAIAAQLAKQRSQAIAGVMGNPDIEGMQLADQTNQGRLGTQSSLYALMAGRAAGAPNMQFNPVNNAANASGALGTALNSAASASGQQGNLLANANNAIRTIPDYLSGGNAAMFGSLSNLLGSGALEQLLGATSGVSKKKTTPSSTEWSDSWGGGS